MRISERSSLSKYYTVVVVSNDAVNKISKST